MDALPPAEVVLTEDEAFESHILRETNANIGHRRALQLTCTKLEQCAGLVAREELLQVDELFLTLGKVVPRQVQSCQGRTLLEPGKELEEASRTYLIVR